MQRLFVWGAFKTGAFKKPAFFGIVLSSFLFHNKNGVSFPVVL